MIYGFADSTVIATAWVICHAPDRLQAWLDRHHDGQHLERAARQHIADEQKRRNRGRAA